MARPDDLHRLTLERRALPRLAPAPDLRAAVENLTRRQALGLARVTDFSGLGLRLCGLAGDPVAARGDELWLTLVAEEGLIPLPATLVHLSAGGEQLGVRLAAPEAAAQHFLLRLYGRAQALAAGERAAE